MDEFAQSKGDDDLFDDDFIPVETTEDVEEADHVAAEVRTMSLETAPISPISPRHHARGSGAGGPRARGRSLRAGDTERTHSRYQDRSPPKSGYTAAPTSSGGAPVANAGVEAIPDTAKHTSEVPKPTSGTPTTVEDHITGAPAAILTESSTLTRPPAVRGDRTATGGVKKPKLTEEELTAKLAAAKTRSENLSAAHARAEADAATFEERERDAAEKRTQGMANRKLMEGEREKNRSRKMAVMSGREWDAQKTEDDYKGHVRGTGRGNHTRDGNGGFQANPNETMDHDLSQYRWNDERGQFRGNGKRRGRGDGRGGPGRGGTQKQDAFVRPNVAAEAEFPLLSATTNVKDQHHTITGPEQSSDGKEGISPIIGAGSWADQVEISQAAKAGHW